MSFGAEKLLTWLIFISLLIVALLYFHFIDIYYIVGMTIPQPPETTSWINKGSQCFPSKTCSSTIEYSSSADPQTVLSFYVNDLPIDGWQIISNTPCDLLSKSCGDLVATNTILGVMKVQIDIPYDTYTNSKKKITIKLQ